MSKKATETPVALEGQLLRAVPTPQIKLASIEDCRREMARIYRETKANKRDTADASRMIFMLSQIAKMIEIEPIKQPLKEKPKECQVTLAEYAAALEKFNQNF